MESILVKISGNVVDDPEQLTQLAVWLTQQQAKGRSIVVVHGAGKQMNLYSERMGLDVNMLEGRRVTNKETLELITGVMGGIVNKTIVDRFRRHSISAVGLSGADATISTAHKRAPLSINGEMVDFGYVGEIDHMDTSLIKALIQSEHIPVIASLTWSPKDGILNVNADTFANRLALALQCSSMIALMDVPAVRDAFGIDIPGLNKLEFEQGVAEGWIKDGMIPKLTSAFAAIDNGLPQIVLTNVDGLLLGKGTTLQAISS
jgi:acetylglutamate kinase